MSPRNVFLSLILCLLISCEQQLSTESVEENVTQAKQFPPEIPPELTSVAEDESDDLSMLPLPQAMKPKKIQEEQKETQPKLQTTPKLPPFSDELLSAVQNWKRIPKSVFPLKSVRIQTPVTFKLFSSDGSQLASSLLEEGKEVVVLGEKDGILTISPAVGSKLRATITMNQTDFKHGVAFLFEMRKKQREWFEAEKNRRAMLSESQQIQNATTRVIQSTNSLPSPLFEELPSPGDYGHGKFCICNDCREKRLAETGSMK